MTFRTRTCVTLALMLAALAVGCGGKASRVAVTGTVTLKGEALSNATIQFFLEGESAPSGGAVVSDGKFEIPDNPGLPPGNYKVSISSPLGGGEGKGGSLTAGAASAPTPSTGYKDKVPAKYNTETELRAEVTSKGPNKFEFKLD